jgi:hypothetical protein
VRWGQRKRRRQAGQGAWEGREGGREGGREPAAHLLELDKHVDRCPREDAEGIDDFASGDFDVAQRAADAALRRGERRRRAALLLSQRRIEKVPSHVAHVGAEELV